MIQIRRQDFAIQSAFNASYERALTPQTPNELIINAVKEQLSGHSFALHPNSAAPIALRPLGGHGGSNSAPVILAPGSTFKPGKPFDAFEWGLPYGWLGGGLILLYIGLDAATVFDWGSPRKDVLIHRVRLPITADNNTLYTLANWPERFPWTRATNATGLNQGTLPSVDVQPVRTVGILSAPLTAPATMRMVWSAVGGSEIAHLDVDWPGLNPAPTTASRPTIQLPAEHIQFGGDDVILTLKDLSGTGALTGLTVDFYRYGQI